MAKLFIACLELATNITIILKNAIFRAKQSSSYAQINNNFCDFAKSCDQGECHRAKVTWSFFFLHVKNSKYRH